MTSSLLAALGTDLKTRSAKRAAKRPGGALSFSRGAWDDFADPRCARLDRLVGSAGLGCGSGGLQSAPCARDTLTALARAAPLLLATRPGRLLTACAVPCARSAAALADVTNRGAAAGTPSRTPAAAKPPAGAQRTPASAAFASRSQARCPAAVNITLPQARRPAAVTLLRPAVALRTPAVAPSAAMRGKWCPATNRTPVSMKVCGLLLVLQATPCRGRALFAEASTAAAALASAAS